MREYIELGSVAHTHGNCLYMHGGIVGGGCKADEHAVGAVPGRDERIADVHEWVAALHEWTSTAHTAFPLHSMRNAHRRCTVCVMIVAQLCVCCCTGCVADGRVRKWKSGLRRPCGVAGALLAT